MRIWFDEGQDEGFGIEHLPFGVFARPGQAPRVGVRAAGQVVDLAGLLADEMFAAGSLNTFLAAGPACWARVREQVTERLTQSRYAAAVRPHLVPLAEVTSRLPFEVADYVDFYCSLEHASNLGRMFRPGEEPLKPNWRHLPVGYHGRAGTVVASGTPVARPNGQRLPGGARAPEFGPSTRLDIEAELGFVVGVPSKGGAGVRTGEFADHVFGVVLVNDWSARDIQAYEYVPLGPFLGKSFATSIAFWVTPLAALDAARIPGRPQMPPVLAHLARTADWGLDIDMEVRLNGQQISRPPYAGMYWTPDQMLAHMTSNGAALRTGDLFASGTVSGAEPGERGSLIEIARNGAEPLKLTGGTTRTFLADGDTVTLAATAPGPGGSRIRLGPVTGTIRPALPCLEA